MEPQARILRSFVDEVERKEAVDQEAEHSFVGEFLRLKRQSTKYRTDKTYSTKAAEKQENFKKNRYKDIVPFDHSRVVLTLSNSKHDTDYINGSFIKGASDSRAYIATQGPLPHTVLDFWRMLWEYNTKVIVMACREFEMGKKKCERYWPEKKEEAFVCGPFTVYCDSEENKGDYLTRTLRVTFRNCSRTLKQLHYVNWPDHGVPDTIPPILAMLQEMRSYQPHDDVPICIHCSAGCGRTGVLCIIDYIWNLLKKQMVPANICIYDMVQKMRTQRPSVVQTKEQYELVYRTIKFLFESYLHSMEAQASRIEVAAAPSPIPAASEFSDPSEELESVLRPRPESQHLLYPESQQRFPLIQEGRPTPNHVAPLKRSSLEGEGDVLPQSHATISSDSDIVSALTAQDKQREQQLQGMWLPVAGPSSQDLEEGACLSDFTRTSPGPGVPGAEESEEEMDDTPLLKPSVPPLVCLTVEDPYFDALSPTAETAPASPWKANPIFSTPSLTLNDQTLELNLSSDTVPTHSDEDIPPPLPMRTPESYILDIASVDAEHSELCGRLAVIIPPNAAAEALRELAGSPPSPVPPLPERTPESYEFAIDQAPVEQMIEDTPAVHLNRIGTSSEWSGNQLQPGVTTQNQMKPWTRSKSLKVKTTFTAPPVTQPAPPVTQPVKTTPNLPPRPPLAYSVTPPPLSPQACGNLTPPLPDRTPESFFLVSEEGRENAALCLQAHQTTEASPRIGVSSEWAGTSQSKTSMDGVMNRSKSVRAKSTTQEPLTAFQQQHVALPPVVVAQRGSAELEEHGVNHRPTQSAETSDKSSGKGMSRTKSLKFFRHKVKPKTAPPPPPTQFGPPPPSTGASTSLFKFGFGHRFGKPKGPRNQPETWV